MSIKAGPRIVTDGLVFDLDAAVSRSYSGSGNTTYNLITGIGVSLVNGVGFSSLNNGSFVFDGNDDYAYSAFPVSNNSDFSIIFWLNYQDVTNSDRGLVATWDAGWNGFGIGTYQGNIRSWVNDGASGGINWAGITTNTWKHYSLSYIFSAKTQYVYIDGVFLNSEFRNTTVTHSTLQIGRGGQNGNQQLTYYPHLKCQISQLTIYNRSLSAQEILQNFNATKGRYLL